MMNMLIVTGRQGSTERRSTHEADDRRRTLYRPRPVLHARPEPADVRRRGLRHPAWDDRRRSARPGRHRPRGRLELSRGGHHDRWLAPAGRRPTLVRADLSPTRRDLLTEAD